MSNEKKLTFGTLVKKLNISKKVNFLISSFLIL